MSCTCIIAKHQNSISNLMTTPKMRFQKASRYIRSFDFENFNFQRLEYMEIAENELIVHLSSFCYD